MPVDAQSLSAALTALAEGAKLHAYQDSGGVWTIGVGHTGPDVHEGLIWTPAQMAQAFAMDEAPLLAMLTGKAPLMVAALADFGFNCGKGALHAVLTGADSIDNPKHTTDHTGKVLSNLVLRRHLESLLLQLSIDQQGANT